MSDYHRFDKGTIDVTVGEEFQINGRAGSRSDEFPLKLPPDVFEIIQNCEATIPKSETKQSYGARSRNAVAPRAVTLKALIAGDFTIEYIYYRAPQEPWNADKYVVHVT